jgi:hypothetical protein
MAALQKNIVWYFDCYMKNRQTDDDVPAIKIKQTQTRVLHGNERFYTRDITGG